MDIGAWALLDSHGTILESRLWPGGGVGLGEGAGGMRGGVVVVVLED